MRRKFKTIDFYNPNDKIVAASCEKLQIGDKVKVRSADGQTGKILYISELKHGIRYLVHLDSYADDINTWYSDVWCDKSEIKKFNKS